jgi:hypothetical protein
MRSALLAAAWLCLPALAWAASDHVEMAAKANRDAIIHRGIDQQAMTVTHDWAAKIVAHRKPGKPFKVDLRDAVRLGFKAHAPDHMVHYVFGVMTKCAKGLGVRGEPNTAGRLPESSFAPATLNALPAIRKFFDDKDVVCKLPMEGFDVYAVGEPDDSGRLDIFAEDENGDGTRR